MATAPHVDTKEKEPDKKSAPTTTGMPAPKDAAALAQEMLLLLTADWLNNDRTHQARIAALLADVTATLAPPVNRDVPYVSQSGGQLSCTMGNWDGEPSSYAYAWHNDGVANGATGATYTTKAEDSGHGLACVVTATNALGSTVAPMSNTVTVA
jgi:hypothetical protein